jgi:hypothetical protein
MFSAGDRPRDSAACLLSTRTSPVMIAGPPATSGRWTVVAGALSRETSLTRRFTNERCRFEDPGLRHKIARSARRGWPCSDSTLRLSDPSASAYRYVIVEVALMRVHKYRGLGPSSRRLSRAGYGRRSQRNRSQSLRASWDGAAAQREPTVGRGLRHQTATGEWNDRHQRSRTVFLNRGRCRRTRGISRQGSERATERAPKGPFPAICRYRPTAV